MNKTFFRHSMKQKRLTPCSWSLVPSGDFDFIRRKLNFVSRYFEEAA